MYTPGTFAGRVNSLSVGWGRGYRRVICLHKKAIFLIMQNISFNYYRCQRVGMLHQVFVKKLFVFRKFFFRRSVLLVFPFQLKLHNYGVNRFVIKQ